MIRQGRSVPATSIDVRANNEVPALGRQPGSELRERVALLADLDWSYKTDRARSGLHELHPYPAKFIPEIPRKLIEELSPPGGLVLDPFCGSGTTLLEASQMGRRSLGVDLSPLAALIARVKCRPMRIDQIDRAFALINQIPLATSTPQLRLLEPSLVDDIPALLLPNEGRAPSSRFRGLAFWFEAHVLRELAAIRWWIDRVDDADIRAALKVALSAIVVQVSKQDSDTRYVRREKDIQPGDASKRFAARARTTFRALGETVDAGGRASGLVVCADSRNLGFVRPDSVDLVVTSPPYPNAWSYHLYHQNRMLVLGMNPWAVKELEIGSHRSYSAKNGSGAATFLEDMTACMTGVAAALKTTAVACVVVGRSIVRGVEVDNADLVRRASAAAGLSHLATIRREIDRRRKAFNPDIGGIATEEIVIVWKSND